MAYRDSTTNGATSNTTSSVTIPTGVVANDIIILSQSRDSTGALGTWPAGFTEILNVALSVVDTQRVGVAWKRASGSESGTYTCGAAAGTDFVLQAFAFSGRDTGNPPVLSSTTNDAANAIGAGLAITAPSVTALAGDDLLYLCLPDTSTGDNSVATAPPSGYTEAEDQEVNFGYAEGAYKENVSAGATGTVAGTLTASGGNAGYVAVHIRIPAASVSVAIVAPRLRTFPNKGSLRQNYGARLLGFKQGVVPVTIQTFSYTATGGLVFSGTSAQLRVRVSTSTGGLTFAGTATRQYTRAEPAPTGGIVFGGSAAFAKGKTVVPSGGLTFGGAAPQSRVKVENVSGGIVFGGAASVSFVGTQRYSYTASGGIVFGGSSPRANVRSMAASGGILFGGSASVSYVPPPGGGSTTRMRIRGLFTFLRKK